MSETAPLVFKKNQIIKILSIVILLIMTSVYIYNHKKSSLYASESVRMKPDYIALATSMYFNKRYDFSADRNLYNMIHEITSNKNKFVNDNDLEKIKEYLNTNEQKYEKLTISPIGLGGGIYLYFAFLLFGYSVISIKYFTYLIITLSFVLFCIAHWKNDNAIATVIIAILALLLFHKYDTVSRTGYYYIRVNPIIGVIPFLHFYYSICSKRTGSLIHVLTLVFQSIIISLLIVYRTNAILYILIPSVLTLTIYLTNILKGPKIFKKRDSYYLIYGILPLVIYIMVSNLIIPFMKNDAYKDYVSAKPFWQKVYLGLGCEKENPKGIIVADEYAIKTTLNSKYNHLGKDLIIYSPESETIMRKEVFDIYKEAPLYYTLFYIKKLYKTVFFMLKNSISLIFASIPMFLIVLFTIILCSFLIERVDKGLIVCSTLLILGFSTSSIIYCLHPPYLAIQTFYTQFSFLIIGQVGIHYAVNNTLVWKNINYWINKK